MRKFTLCTCLLLACISLSHAQLAQSASHMVPTGKGWGEQAPAGAVVGESVSLGHGIAYHGGKVMPGTINAYIIWYGNWTNGPKPSDSQSTVTLINSLLGSTGGMGGSPYFRINTTYGDATNNVSGNIVLAGSTTNNYGQGKNLSDNSIKTIVTNAIKGGKLPKDTNGIYFVLTTSDVNETSGFCTFYCGWHTHATILTSDIKYSFVGNPDRCPSGCEAQTKSPNGNSGADGMASIIAHEAEEAATDPDLNAWYDTSGQENADKCAWKWGPLTGTLGNGAYNQTFGTHHWLIQMNWENSRAGGCAKKLGGTFYTH